MTAATVELWIDGAWLDVTAAGQVVFEERLTIHRKAGWLAVNATASPGSCEFVLDNTPDPITGVGPWSHLHPHATYYGKIMLGTRIRATVSGSSRFYGEIATLRPDADTTGVLGRVRVIARGALGRKSIGQQPLSSPATTAYSAPENDGTRLAYWPLEEESRADGVTSPTGSPDIRVTGSVTFGGSTAAPSTARMVTFGETGQLHATVPFYTATGEVKVCALWAIPESNLPNESLLMRLEFDGGTVDWIDVRYGNTGAISCDWYVNNFKIDTAPAVAFGSSVLGQDHFFLSLEFAQDGADVDCSTLVVSPATGGSAGSDTVVAQTLGRIRKVTVAQTACDGAGFGQLAVGNDTSAFPNFISPTTGGGLGTLAYNGESSLRRIERLAIENGVAVDYSSRSAVSNRQGEQAINTLLACWQEAADADGGMLFDDRDQHGVYFVKSNRLMNMVPELTLDYASGHVVQQLRPADLDTLARNDVTVTRREGGKDRHVVPDGDPYHYSTEDPPSGFGRIDDAYNLSLSQDRMTGPTAGWWAHIGSARPPRFEEVAVRLHSSRMASLVTAALAVDLGDCIQIDNPPTWCGPDPVRALVHGYTEVIDTVSHEVTFDLAPADPWEVEVVNTAGSTLAAAVTSGATSWKLATSSGPAWTTSGQPFYLSSGGEAVTVSSITTDTPAFIAAGTVAHADNASVVPGLPAGITADVGQLLVLVAAIYNSGVGVPDQPAGWSTISGASDNVRIMAKYYVTGDAAPTVTFTGGVAGATTSARIVAFSGLSRHLDGSTSTQLNTSVQDIAIPALTVHPSTTGGHRRTNDVAFVVTWKADDSTDVATPSGFVQAFDSNTTTGNDQSIALFYRIDTTATSVAAATLTVTGGAAAISRGKVFALRALQTATVSRSTNGIVAAHVAASAVNVWRPGAVAL